MLLNARSAWAAKLGASIAILWLSNASVGRAAADIVMTAPPEPVAGQPWSLVYSATILGDLDPSTGPEIEVVGNTIRVRPRAECNEPFCDVLSKAVFRVEMPALPAGVYNIQTVGVENEDYASAPPFDITVVAGPPPSAVRPVDGIWSEAMKSGRGLTLQRRGDVVGLGAFDMRPGSAEYFDPIWQVDAPLLRGNSLVAALRRAGRQYSDPSCLGCARADGAPVGLSNVPLRLRFESERRAWMDMDDGSTHPLVSFPYGVSYVPITLSDTVDDEFGSLPLPDLQGRWLFDLPDGAQVVELSAPQVEAGRVRFAGGDLSIECRSATADERAGCALLDASSAWFARLGDVSESQMRFRPETNADGLGFYAQRIESP